MQFATPSDGWAMADNDRSGFTDLFTSETGAGAGRRDPARGAGRREVRDRQPGRRPGLQTPFVLNGRDAWLPVETPSYGQSSMLEVFMTSDAGGDGCCGGGSRGQGCWTLFS